MATNGKTINAKATPQTSVLDTSTLKGVSASDPTLNLNLVDYVRANAPYIVSALSCAASRAGEQGAWSDMNSYLGIANEISILTGFAASAPAGTNALRTMAAGSGASG